MITLDWRMQRESLSSAKVIPLVLGVLAVIATAFVWAGLSLTDVLSILRR
jgi:hypothetical protein